MTNPVLVVEDNDDIQILFKLVLESEGYEVRVVDNSEDALQYLESHQPQLILMDIMMPGSNGIELSHTIKQELRFQSLPILLVSAVDRIKTQELDYSQANDILYKPFDLDDLVDRVDELTGDRAPKFPCQLQV